ncbi:MAG: hypothetical protein NT109_06455 [Flavobacteriia bacterium]|nr:hypothetical protein [Flavobacteriia bacterium]
MTVYTESLRKKSLHQAKLKLSKHRELGEKSTLDIFQVADLLDKISHNGKELEHDNSIFFSVGMN